MAALSINETLKSLDVIYADLIGIALKTTCGAAYAEVWVCEKCPDHIAVFNVDDEIVASYPLPIANHMIEQ